MQIIWHGQSCFEIITSSGKNSQVSIVIDPFSKEIGLRPPKLEADILLVSRQDYEHNNIKAVSGPSANSGQAPFLIEGPGEYEIKNIFIKGISSWHDSLFRNLKNSEIKTCLSQGKKRGENTIYTIEAEEMRLCHLGDFGQKELTEEQLEKIGDIDILMVPVGGIYTISGKEAVGIMSQIEPKITLPMHYHIPKLKIKLDGLDKFLKPLGIKSITPANKLTIKKKDIPTEEAKIIVLKP